ncbi:TonB-linked SusC/RagA family outer membrane protein [Arcticibacter tournemirensis]|uniref:SusC/RagA family TonB-linked outer membrane protein n=1 Tax=Arcticibacter tournemirensis TaxID=699437 RepID=A0A5M9GUD1_9SPHI|nr:SusC/RagA family TonB-linked outer membrane protein [Arcticibacter tournemirensis]KAA8477479.1 SusC/RagA family TonB-linked outer membrane protein [Arcticibacter tournemirensis]TQM51304.1 TonB-linked SusC/RagA family outer membrane protein [Arcticibacter tournemirensis]
MKKKYVFVLVACCLLQNLFAQTTITGIVRDSKNQPLDFVSVVIKGSSTGVMTDLHGKFTITASPNATLIISSVGYERQEYKLNGQTSVVIKLESSQSDLNEVVIIGYQSVTRKKNTAAISSISGKDLENIPAASFDMILQGRLAGLNVQNITGSPGAVSTVYVRGTTGISNSYDEAQLLSSPLYVVDGVPQPTEQYANINTGTGTNFLAGINPNDIESVQVLRDASAAAIYGSRAANGVILITTKPGINSDPVIKINGYSGMVVRPNLRDVVLGTAERAQKMGILQEQLTYSQLSNLPFLLTDSLNPAFNGHTNYQDLFYQKGRVNNGDISMAGGNKLTNYRFSAAYYDEEGVVKATGLKRFSSRLNLLSRAAKERITINPIIAFTNINRARGNGDGISPFPLSAGSMPSSLFNLSESKKTFYTGGFDEDLDKNISNQLSLNLNINAKILPVLTLTSQTSFGYNTGKRNYNRPSVLNSNLGNYSSTWNSAQENWQTSNYLTYNDAFGKHSLTMLVGQDVQHDKYEVTLASGDAGSSDQIKVVQGFLQDFLYGYSDYQAWGLLSYYSRISYDFDSRYIFSGSLRTDGSSRFGKNNRWGWFPSASVAWLLSEESFLKDNPAISLFKIRASYGSVGNLPRENYLAYSLYRVNAGSYSGSAAASYNGVPAVTPNYTNGVAQDDLTWEKSNSWNIGTDIELYSGKYTISADIYNRETSNQLFAVQLPTNTGYDYAQTNSVAVRNSGVELILSAKPLSRESRITWLSNFNISYNKNRIKSLPNRGRDLVMSGDRFDASHILSIGSPINSFYLFQTLGVYSTINDIPVNPYTGALFGNSNGAYGPGMFYLKDLDGDFLINSYNNGINPDKIPSGDPNPKWTGGWNNTFNYKNFSLSFFLNFTLDRDVLNLYEADAFGFSAAGNNSTLAGTALPDLSKYNVWRQDGDKADYAKLDIGTYRFYYTSAQSFFLENGSYVRLKNIIARYNFGKNVFQRFGLKNLAVYGIVDNVLTWKASKKLPDPEAVNQYGEYNGNGYPIPKKFTLGIEITL